MMLRPYVKQSLYIQEEDTLTTIKRTYFLEVYYTLNLKAWYVTYPIQL